MNHHVFEWLHKNIQSLWRAALTDSFFYLGQRISVAIYFEVDDDAMLFHLACEGGRLLADYGPTIKREADLKRMRSHIDALSRHDRQTRYPALDQFLIENYSVPT